jgi:hypothetical protein
MLAICGGEADPNIQHLMRASRKLKIAVLPLVFGPSSAPCIHWDVTRNRITFNRGRRRIEAAFIRYDVFTPVRSNATSSESRAHAWFAAVQGWIAGNPQITTFNRSAADGLWKPLQLKVAQACGLAIPRTVISNDTRAIQTWVGRRTAIVKPVGGGEYTQRLHTVIPITEKRRGVAAAPAIVQDELTAPDIRVFGVGARQFVFRIDSAQLDYREDVHSKIELEKRAPPLVLERLRRLASTLQLDFYAADFKTCARTREIMFLEINNAPMFAAFDRVANGDLCGAMLRTLTA